jgi:hypothetical protein
MPKAPELQIPIAAIRHHSHSRLPDLSLLHSAVIGSLQLSMSASAVAAFGTGLTKIEPLSDNHCTGCGARMSGASCPSGSTSTRTVRGHNYTGAGKVMMTALILWFTNHQSS